MGQLLLEMSNISKEFPGVKALDNVGFNLKEGEVHVLLGENGAGKSTLIKILSGAYKKDDGKILIEGKLAEINNPSDAFRYGISVIYQEFNLNPHMSIFENIFLGKEFRTKFGTIDKAKAIEKTTEIAGYVGLNANPSVLVKDLSIAEKQLVEIAKALMIEAKIIVFDEPTATLTSSEIDYLFEIIRNLKKKGLGIVYISHRMNELKELGDRCTIFRDGKDISTEILCQVSKKELINKMVGREIDENKKRDNRYFSDEDVLKVERICYKNKVKNVSFELKKGEILGIAGLVGAGRTELAKAIIGEYSRDAGEVFVQGKPVTIGSPCDAINNRLAYLSEDRKDEGLFLQHNIKKNITISSLCRIQDNLFLNRKKEEQICQELIKKLRVKTPSLETAAANLSGGNQQKVVIAKGLCQQAIVYIFDEPTRGIDVGAKEEIYRTMEELVKEGCSIIMISSDLPELLRMSDRVMVMWQGQVNKIFDNTTNLTQEEILTAAIGG